MINRGSFETLNKILADTPLPRVFKVRQHFDETKLEDPIGTLRKELDQFNLKAQIKPGMRIAITAGSRGIDNMKDVLREVAAYVRACGGQPFLFPAMGSHGGAMAEGQITMMASHGFTEEYCGCPILSSMETVQIGEALGLPVYVDKNAYEADGVIAVNRVKLHTSFRGKYESGLMKILTVGMGKQKGAETIHKDGFGKVAERVEAFGKVVLEKMNILCGVALVENAQDKTAMIEVLSKQGIIDREPELLQIAKSKMPRILIPETDALVVQNIGKNITGAGMDPNITGIWSSDFGSGGLKTQRSAILDIYDESHGNGMGLGLADVICYKAFEKYNFEQTYPNVLTSIGMRSSKIPMVMQNDEQTIRALIRICIGIDRDNPRMIFIRDTLHLGEILLSAAHYEEAKATPGIEILSEPAPLAFDAEGNLLF